MMLKKIINGYFGVFSPSKNYFQYINGKKIVISGVSEEELEKILL